MWCIREDPSGLQDFLEPQLAATARLFLRENYILPKLEEIRGKALPTLREWIREHRTRPLTEPVGMLIAQWYLRIQDEDGPADVRGLAHWWHANHLGRSGRRTDAVVEADRAQECLADEPGLVWRIRLAIANWTGEDKGPAAALTRFDELLAELAPSDPRRSFTRFQRAEWLIRAGDAEAGVAEMWSLAAEGEATRTDSDDPYYPLMAAHYEESSGLADQRRERARAELADALARYGEGSSEVLEKQEALVKAPFGPAHVVEYLNELEKLADLQRTAYGPTDPRTVASLDTLASYYAQDDSEPTD